MKKYKVIWEIDVYANSPREAALAAQEFQRRTNTTATVFDVIDDEGNAEMIDLLEECPCPENSPPTV